MPPRKPPTRRPRPAPTPAPAPPAAERTPRERMVLSAVALLAERGLSGTSFSEVIQRSGAPRGSIYHHFPDGKDGLTAAAIDVVANHVLALLRLRDGSTPRQVVHRFVEAWRAALERTGFVAGCAIAAVTNERVEHPVLGARAANVFVAWEAELGAALGAAGLTAARATSAAALTLAAIEGALILCRARGEIGPLDRVAAALDAFVAG